MSLAKSELSFIDDIHLEKRKPAEHILCRSFCFL